MASVDGSASDVLGRSPLLLAAENERWDDVIAGVTAGDTPEAVRLDRILSRDLMGRTVLHWACHAAPFPVVGLIVDSIGTKLRDAAAAQTTSGDTPLHWLAKRITAVSSEALATLQQFARGGADGNIPNSIGETAVSILRNTLKPDSMPASDEVCQLNSIIGTLCDNGSVSTVTSRVTIAPSRVGVKPAGGTKLTIKLKQ